MIIKVHGPASFDLVVHGGTVVTASGSYRADVGVRKGLIVAIEEDLSSSTSDRVVDASGCLVLPGAIDVHTHFGNAVEGHETADDYESGTISAAFGGITTILNYCFQEKGRGLGALLKSEKERASREAVIDFGFHVVITDVGVTNLEAELRSLVEGGSPSIKFFTAVGGLALRDEEVLELLSAAGAAGVLVNVHAEDGALVRFLSDRLLASGAFGIGSLGASRPPVAEASAIARVALYARLLGVQLYIVHVSSAEALNAIVVARERGGKIYVETRPAYLFMDESRYHKDESSGRLVACWPPLRSVLDQEALWDGLRDGSIQTYATDHTSWMAAEKGAPGLTFEQVPGGFANVETSIGMLYSEGVVPGRISLETFVSVTATQPAKIFGLWPRKGAVQIGSDADLFVLDPEARKEVRGQNMHSRSDVEVYEGYESIGWPVVTISRGEVIVDHGRWLGNSGRGQYIERPASGVQ
jgi:dihydropyrimidinase